MKVPSVPVEYYSHEPDAHTYDGSADPCRIKTGLNVRPTTLAGKFVKFISRKDEIEFLCHGLYPFALSGSFNSIAVRLHSAIIAFVNDRTIRSDLVMFDTTSDRVGGHIVTDEHKFVHLENGWYIQTKHENTYIELCTRLIVTEIPVSFMERVRNWFTKKGPTSKDIPAVRYTVVLKVFNSPWSFYSINLFNYDVIASYSAEAYYKSNLDYSIVLDKLTQEAKERCDGRKVYFKVR